VSFFSEFSLQFQLTLDMFPLHLIYVGTEIHSRQNSESKISCIQSNSCLFLFSAHTFQNLHYGGYKFTKIHYTGCTI
jgi:hypothetical protein